MGEDTVYHGLPSCGWRALKFLNKYIRAVLLLIRPPPAFLMSFAFFARSSWSSAGDLGVTKKAAGRGSDAAAPHEAAAPAAVKAQTEGSPPTAVPEATRTGTVSWRVWRLYMRSADLHGVALLLLACAVSHLNPWNAAAAAAAAAVGEVTAGRQLNLCHLSF